MQRRMHAMLRTEKGPEWRRVSRFSRKACRTSLKEEEPFAVPVGGMPQRCCRCALRAASRQAEARAGALARIIH